MKDDLILTMIFWKNFECFQTIYKLIDVPNFKNYIGKFSKKNWMKKRKINMRQTSFLMENCANQSINHSFVKK